MEPILLEALQVYLPVSAATEFRMISFFAKDVTSAQILRGFYIVFSTMIVMSYTSMLRSALMAKDLTEPLDDIKVSGDCLMILFDTG